MTLTSDLVFRIIVCRAYLLLLFEVGISNLVCGYKFGVFGQRSVPYHNKVNVTLNLTSDLFLETALSLVHISYIL